MFQTQQYTGVILMTTIWPNGFAGGVDWRSWSDGLWQTASAGGLGPDASGEPEATDPDAPAVVITNATPAILVSYTPPNGMASNPFDEMDLAAYFSLIGYDPSAIEEMNANGSYRSEHDIYQANGGLQSQAEAAWRRSGQWASGDGWNDVNRELFLNKYMDSAYGIDPEAGTSLNDPRLARLAAEALNKAKKAGDLQGLEALKTALLQSGFGIREVPIGSAFDPNLNDATVTVKFNTVFVLTPTGSSGSYQTGGMDGFQLVGRPGGYGPAGVGIAAELAKSMRGPNARDLTANEIKLVQEAFGSTIDLSDVKIVLGDGGNPNAKLAFSLGNPAITQGNTIYFNPNAQTEGRPYFSADFSLSPKGIGILMHEFTHVRQFQQLGFTEFYRKYAADLINNGLDRNKVYDYQLRNTTYATETLEGQAQMVGDYAQQRAANGNAATAQMQALANRLRGSGIYGL